MAAEEGAGHSLFTSVLTFAGVHHALTSKLNDKSLCPIAFAQAKQKFELDWENQLAVIELGANILSLFPGFLNVPYSQAALAVPSAQAAAASSLETFNPQMLQRP